MNIGNPEEHTIAEVAAWAPEAAGVSEPVFSFVPRMEDGPTVPVPGHLDGDRGAGVAPTDPRSAVEHAVRWFAEELSRPLRV